MKLTYNGDRSGFDPLHLVGPDGDGEFWRPVTARYDLATNMTEIQFELMPREELPEAAIYAGAEQIHQRQKILLAEANVTGRIKAGDW